MQRLHAATGLAALTIVASTGLAYAVTDTSHLDEPGGATRLAGDQSAAVAQEIKPGRARNVILLIGDGMGDSEITAARNYAEGAAGRFKGIDALPLTGSYTTYSLAKATGLPDYVPDSAATGSAWATGTKTYDNAVSVNLTGQPQRTLLELAKANGLKTGDVTTSEVQDATPAVQVAHISARSCYGPNETTATCPTEALENGGLGSITEQLLNTRPDVTLAGGAATFAQVAKAGPYVGKTLTQQAVERGYQMVSDKAGLAGVSAANQTAPLLGLFAAGNLPVRWVGPAATNGGAALPPVSCTDNPARPATQPTLAEMTTKAIGLLENPNGFFLQVEGASIDKADHAADACGQIGETVDLDEAVQVALAYAKAKGNTSVFVTADHGHTSQIIEVGSSSPGRTVALTTADGAPMAINYGTSTGASQQHTGTQVRIAGYGPQAANIVGLTDQTDLFFTIKRALSLGEPAVPGGGSTTPGGASTGASSDAGRVDASKGKVKQGARTTLLAQLFSGDRGVVFTVKNPKGKVATYQRQLSGGAAALVLKLKKTGTWTITVTGQQTGRTASETVKVVKKKRHQHDHGHH
jgi:alkaline phosphatase